MKIWGGTLTAVFLVAKCRRRLILPISLAACNARRYTAEWSIATSASSRCFRCHRCSDVGAVVDVGASDDDGEYDGTSSSGVATPEGETPPRGDSLCW